VTQTSRSLIVFSTILTLSVGMETWIKKRNVMMRIPRTEMDVILYVSLKKDLNAHLQENVQTFVGMASLF